MAYRKFDTGTWQDPWFEDLSPKAKLAFIYLWTNEICTQAGIYEISEKRIKFELGYGIDTVYEELKDKVEWYPEQKIVHVKNFFRRQTQNSKFAISALNSVKEDPFKLQLFIDRNKEIIEGYKIDLAPYFDTISILYPTETDTDTEADTVTETDNESPNGDSCPEPQGDPGPSPVISIPMIKSHGDFPIFQSDIDQWQDTFPGVDVLLTLKIIKQWNIDNPAKRKTKSGIRQHISTWLGREQNKGRPKVIPMNGVGRSEQNAQACQDFVNG